MNKFIFILSLIAGAINYTPGAYGQYANKTNGFIQVGVAVPYSHMGDYYKPGFCTEFHVVHSLSKRNSDARLGLLLNTGLGRFGGQSSWVPGNNGNLIELKADPINVIPLHAGLRLDMGGIDTKDGKKGLYLSQDFGITYIDGPTGGTRYGHTFNIGCVFKRFDIDFGFDTWRGSTGNKFHYVAFKLGYMIF